MRWCEIILDHDIMNRISKFVPWIHLARVANKIEIQKHLTSSDLVTRRINDTYCCGAVKRQGLTQRDLDFNLFWQWNEKQRSLLISL